MKASVKEVTRYSFCPKFYEQKGDFPPPEELVQKPFSLLVTFAFRKLLETGNKVTSKQLFDRWTKIFWESHSPESKEDVQKYNKSLIGIKGFYDWFIELETPVLAVNLSICGPLYNHQIEGDIPVVLAARNGGVELILIEPLLYMAEVKSAPIVRYLSAVVDQETPVSSIMVLSLTGYKTFKMFEFEPDKRFWEGSIQDLLGLLQSMQERISYPNTLACRFCPLSSTCEVFNE